MLKKIIKILESKEVVAEFSEVVVQLRKMQITDLEFDEFAKLYFKICSPYPEYLAEVWPNVVEITKEIVASTSTNKGKRNVITINSYRLKLINI